MAGGEWGCRRRGREEPKGNEKCRRKSSLLGVESNVGMYEKVGDRRRLREEQNGLRWCR